MKEVRLKVIAIILFILVFQNINSQITLSHNIGNTPITTKMSSCDYDEYWARVFTLSDFGISTSDQFLIKTGQIAISNAYNGASFGIEVFSIDEGFPDSIPKSIGSSYIKITNEIGNSPEIIQLNFKTNAVVPAGVKRILVVAHQFEEFYNPNYKKAIIAGTAKDKGISWFKGCREHYKYVSTENLITPVPDANFFINVTGNKLNTKNFGANVTLKHNLCDDIIETSIHSCTSSYIYWARDFNLQDFGISLNEEYIIYSGQVALNKTGYTPEVQFNIYKIDNNFPNSFSETDLIGSSQAKEVSPNINRNSQIIQVNFDTPIVVPAGVERILVEVKKGIVGGDGLAFIADLNKVMVSRGKEVVSSELAVTETATIILINYGPV